MGQSDRLELALAEIERVRASQDEALQAAWVAFADLGHTTVHVEAEHLRHLSECADCSPCQRNSGANRLVIAPGRC